jgi:hypothetical protein
VSLAKKIVGRNSPRRDDGREYVRTFLSLQFIFHFFSHTIKMKFTSNNEKTGGALFEICLL